MYNNLCIYLPFILYLGYSIYSYTKDKSKKTLYINVGVGAVIQGLVLSIYSTHLNKKRIHSIYNKKSCLLNKNKSKQKKSVRFDNEVRIRYIPHRSQKLET